MEFRSPGATAHRRTYGHLQRVSAARPVAETTELWTHLVKRLSCKSEELDFGDRDKAGDGQANRGADDGRLGEWGVEDSLPPKLLNQTIGRSEDPTEPAHVESQDHYALVTGHLRENRRPNGLHDRELGHRRLVASEKFATLRLQARRQLGKDVVEDLSGVPVRRVLSVQHCGLKSLLGS